MVVRAHPGLAPGGAVRVVVRRDRLGLPREVGGDRWDPRGRDAMAARQRDRERRDPDPKGHEPRSWDSFFSSSTTVAIARS